MHFFRTGESISYIEKSKGRTTEGSRLDYRREQGAFLFPQLPERLWCQKSLTFSGYQELFRGGGGL